MVYRPILLGPLCIDQHGAIRTDTTLYIYILHMFDVVSTTTAAAGLLHPYNFVIDPYRTILPIYCINVILRFGSGEMGKLILCILYMCAAVNRIEVYGQNEPAAANLMTPRPIIALCSKNGLCGCSANASREIINIMNVSKTTIDWAASQNQSNPTIICCGHAQCSSSSSSSSSITTDADDIHIAAVEL